MDCAGISLKRDQSVGEIRYVDFGHFQRGVGVSGAGGYALRFVGLVGCRLALFCVFGQIGQG